MSSWRTGRDGPGGDEFGLELALRVVPPPRSSPQKEREPPGVRPSVSRPTSRGAPSRISSQGSLIGAPSADAQPGERIIFSRAAALVPRKPSLVAAAPAGPPRPAPAPVWRPQPRPPIDPSAIAARRWHLRPASAVLTTESPSTSSWPQPPALVRRGLGKATVPSTASAVAPHPASPPSVFPPRPLTPPSPSPVVERTQPKPPADRPTAAITAIARLHAPPVVAGSPSSPLSTASLQRTTPPTTTPVVAPPTALLPPSPSSQPAAGLVRIVVSDPGRPHRQATHDLDPAALAGALPFFKPLVARANSCGHGDGAAHRADSDAAPDLGPSPPLVTLAVPPVRVSCDVDTFQHLAAWVRWRGRGDSLEVTAPPPPALPASLSVPVLVAADYLGSSALARQAAAEAAGAFGVAAFRPGWDLSRLPGASAAPVASPAGGKTPKTPGRWPGPGALLERACSTAALEDVWTASHRPAEVSRRMAALATLPSATKSTDGSAPSPAPTPSVTDVEGAARRARLAVNRVYELRVARLWGHGAGSAGSLVGSGGGELASSASTLMRCRRCGDVYPSTASAVLECPMGRRGAAEGEDAAVDARGRIRRVLHVPEETLSSSNLGDRPCPSPTRSTRPQTAPGGARSARATSTLTSDTVPLTPPTVGHLGLPPPVARYVAHLRSLRHPWRSVYWRLWARSRAIPCSRCGRWARLADWGPGTRSGAGCRSHPRELVPSPASRDGTMGDDTGADTASTLVLGAGWVRLCCGRWSPYSIDDDPAGGCAVQSHAPPKSGRAHDTARADLAWFEGRAADDEADDEVYGPDAAPRGWAGLGRATGAAETWERVVHGDENADLITPAMPVRERERGGDNFPLSPQTPGDRNDPALVARWAEGRGWGSGTKTRVHGGGGHVERVLCVYLSLSRPLPPENLPTCTLS